MAVLSLLVGVGNFAQLLNAEKEHFIWPERPVGLISEIYASGSEIYGKHLAEVMSNTLYPAGEAKLTLFRNKTYDNGTGSFKFKQEIAGLPVIAGMIVVHTNDQGEIYFRRGPILEVESGSGKVAPPSTEIIESVSTLLGGKSLDQIEYQSSCYFYNETTGETLPAHILFVDTRDVVNPDSKKIIVGTRTGKVLNQEPLLVFAKDREIYDNELWVTPPPNPARSEGDPPVAVTAVNRAYITSGLTWIMYDERFEHDSWGDSGETIEVSVNWGSYNSARWDPINERINIGGGDQNYDAAFDVMAHEFSHGVAFGEGLVHSGDAGALHESFGDCMAAVYDYDNGGTVWEIAEGLYDGPLRIIDDPDSGPASQADRWTEMTGNAHHDSTIASLAFVLAVDGGTHPYDYTAIDVTGCGMTMGASVLYNALCDKYDSTESMYWAAVDQTLAGFDYTYSVGCSFASAWYAVGISGAFWQEEGTDDWEVTYMGWAFLHTNDTQFKLPNDVWHSYTDYDSDNGGMAVYSFDTESWFWVSAETFPLYYDYTTENWDTFTGTFE